MTILVLDWGSLCDHLRHIPWEDVFKLSASTAAGDFWWLVQVELMYISFISVSGQVSLVSTVLSCLCSCHSPWKSLFSIALTEQFF